MNVATISQVPLQLPIQRMVEVRPAAKPSTANFLINIPKDADAALKLSEQIADTFAANPGLKIANTTLIA